MIQEKQRNHATVQVRNIVHLLIGHDKMLNDKNIRMLQMAFCLSWVCLRGADLKNQAQTLTSSKTLLQVTTFGIQILQRSGKEAINFIAQLKAQ